MTRIAWRVCGFIAILLVAWMKNYCTILRIPLQWLTTLRLLSMNLRQTPESKTLFGKYIGAYFRVAGIIAFKRFSD